MNPSLIPIRRDPDGPHFVTGQPTQSRIVSAPAAQPAVSLPSVASPAAPTTPAHSSPAAAIHAAATAGRPDAPAGEPEAAHHEQAVPRQEQQREATHGDEQVTREPTVGAPSAHVVDPRPSRACTVISLANQKGGVAKTTTTMNLGAALHETGKRVLVVDLDPQSNLTMSFGIDVEALPKSIFDVLVHRYPIEHVIRKTPECDVAVASIDLAGAEMALSSMIGRERMLEKALSTVRKDYDYILIDTPPSLGLLTINAFTASDEVIVPVQSEYLSLRGLVQLDNTLSVIREHLNPKVRISGILRTMYDDRTLHAREAVELLERTYGKLLMKTTIRKTIRFAEAPVQGSSVLTYESNGKAAAMYRELAQEVLHSHVHA